MTEEEIELERASLDYVNLSQNFTMDKIKSNYNKQYCRLYLARLEQMQNILHEKVLKRLGDKYPIVKLHKLTETESTLCVVIGTLYKSQKLKPSVLSEILETSGLPPQPVLNRFTDVSDELFIEDELQRYQLIGSVSCDKLVTGVSCAVLGQDIGRGKFEVSEIFFAGYRDQIQRPIVQNDVYVVFISGIDMANIADDMINLQLFNDWILGLVDLDNNIPNNQIARVIIAGNSIRTKHKTVHAATSLTSRIFQSQDTIEAVKSFDSFLCELAQFIDIDVMPGEHDPSSHILPQKPMHHCMFPLAAQFGSLSMVSNPYSCSLDGVRMLGTSGQPVRDLMWFTEIDDAIEGLESCLNWGHLAPTCPDTLGSYPFEDRDPFVLEDCPHVFFVGNQERFDTKNSKGESNQLVRLIAIPEFSKTNQVCLLNLKTLECDTIVFKAGKFTY